MKIAIIPARGGSKRIPRKNIRPFHGKPMIGWSIEAAIKSQNFDHILVSTDDTEVMDVARQFGAAVPFVRPSELADDFTPTVPVIAHAVDWVENNVGAVRMACCIYATAPFVQHSDLGHALSALENSGASYAFPVTSFPYPIQRAVRLDGDRKVTMFHPEHALTRSQDLEEGFHDAGQFYWGTRDAWMNGLPIMGPDAVALPIPRFRVQDIDTPEDWERAENIFRLMTPKLA